MNDNVDDFDFDSFQLGEGEPETGDFVSDSELVRVHTPSNYPVDDVDNLDNNPLPINQGVHVVRPSGRVLNEVRGNNNPDAPVVRRRTNSQSNTVPETQPPSGRQPKKKKKDIYVWLGIIIFFFISVGCILFLMNRKPKEEPQVVSYESTGKFAYDSLITALNTYNATSIDNCVGTEDGDSFLAQEWSYANNNNVREEFIKSVCACVSFKYPSAVQKSTLGEDMLDENNNPILSESSMDNGEAVTVSHVDYMALSETMKEDKNLIAKYYNDSGFVPEDYDYTNEMIDLLLNYINSKETLPTIDTDLTLPISYGDTPKIGDDSELDKLLFSSNEFHNMCDVFSQIATGFTGYTTEIYYVKEEQPNPEYDQWKIRFDKYYKKDNGKFVKGKSKWEPWYLRDKNNNYILDKNGKKTINYYTVKDDEGNDWIQPSKTILVDVPKTRDIPVKWENESVVSYCFIGAYYCQNEYKGSFIPDVRVGDGTADHPAGIGTPIITKCLGTDGVYHDIKITLVGYWKGKDAIDYAVSFSEKNRGFDVNSVIQLICYEVKIDNLENTDFTFNSDMFLCDENANKSERTGTVFGFYSTATVKAKESVVINDWATSTELEQKFVGWGYSFQRAYKVVYFKLLAGEGNVEPYSAYKAFTGTGSDDLSSSSPNSSAPPSSSEPQSESTQPATSIEP